MEFADLTADGSLRPPRLALGLVLALAAAGSALAQCRPGGLQLVAEAERSRWREHDAQSRLLVTERGMLRGLAFESGLDCASLQARLRVATADGERDYDGRSTTGRPIASRSDITRHTLELGVGRPFGADGRSRARWQLLLGWQQTRRHIADSGPVLGYPERFTLWQAGLAAGWRLHGEGWQFDTEAALAAGPPGRLALALPNADPATLRLGRSHGARLQARLGSGERAGGWGWELGLRYRLQVLAAGPSQALTRNGVVVGGAAQPRSTDGGWTLSVALQHTFR